MSSSNPSKSLFASRPHRAPLEDLPCEIHRAIMTSCDSPRTLYRLISASPTYLASFSLSPWLILSTILLRLIPVEAMHHYLALVYMPTRAGNLDYYLAHQLPRFLDQCFTPIPFTFPSDMTHLSTLCRIHRRIELFAALFKEDVPRDVVISDSKEGVSSDVQDSLDLPHSLSADSDPTRLLRAILRFEICCKIFPSDSEVRSDAFVSLMFPPYPPTRILDNHIPKPEMEEIRSVYNYFADAVRFNAGDLRDGTVRAIVRASGLLPSRMPFQLDPVGEGSSTTNTSGMVSNCFCSPGLDYLTFLTDAVTRGDRYFVHCFISEGFNVVYKFMRALKALRAAKALESGGSPLDASALAEHYMSLSELADILDYDGSRRFFIVSCRLCNGL